MSGTGPENDDNRMTNPRQPRDTQTPGLLLCWKNPYSWSEMPGLPKTTHLLHPLRTAMLARDKASAHFALRKFAAESERDFFGDPRYDLENVTRGFAPRIDPSNNDAELLDRICTAYIKSSEHQRFVSQAWQATKWWKQVRQRSLRPVIQALETRDLPALDTHYRTFFRNGSGTGLVGVPFGRSKEYFGPAIPDVYRHYYLGDALRRIDYWKERTANRFALDTLTGPRVGNPFGVEIEGTLVPIGSEYQHFCAQRIIGQLGHVSNVVAEIGGGFGGMAYYLLRDRPGVTYLDFDVPESIALTSYYLMKSFPALNFLLYGERKLTQEEISHADVVLMPLYELEKLPQRCVNVTFSSHAMSDISPGTMGEYVNAIGRITQNCFLHIGNSRGATVLSEVVSRSRASLGLEATRASSWYNHKISRASENEVECLYRSVFA